MKKILLLSFLFSISFSTRYSFAASESFIELHSNCQKQADEITITLQPADFVGCVENYAEFHVTAEGENLKYQWQVFANGSFTDINGAESDTYHTPMLAPELNGNVYRCVITNASETRVISNTARLIVNTGLEINSQTGDVMVWENGTATFSVSAKGEGLQYIWKVNTGGGPELVENGNSSVLKLSNVNTQMNWYSYSCDVVSSCGILTSTPSMLLVLMPSICMVTFDKNTGKNLVIFEKPYGQELVDDYRIYRQQNESGDYQLISSLGGNAFSTYVDQDSKPDQRSYSYKIAVKDIHGNISNLSPAHKTVYLSIAEENGSPSISWTSYEGIGVGSYSIYRGTTENNMELITSVSDGTNSFTDVNPPAADILYYQIETQGTLCVPTARVAEDFSLRSNIVNTKDIVTSIRGAALKLGVYPNPTKESITVEGLKEDGIANILDLSGRVVKAFDGTQKVLSLAGIDAGIYLLEVIDSEGKKTTTIIKE